MAPRRLSRERRDVVGLLEERGAMSPSAVASVLQKHPSSVRRLLFGMLSDGQLECPEKGLYGVPEGESNPESEHPTNQGEHLPDEGEHGTEGGEFVSPSGIYCYSEADGGMIPTELSRKRKGYR
jgi:hypothetical protein